MIKATGIGSVPHQDMGGICELTLKAFPDLPYWPQLFRVSPKETMFIQYAEGLPCLESDLERKTVQVNKANEAKELLTFYDYYEHDCHEYFKIGTDRACGFYALLEKVVERTHPCVFVKGQVVGPVTFLASVASSDGRALLHDPMLLDAVVKGLAMKAVWQAKEIEKIGKVPIIFFDEPFLSGFGSAFVSLERTQVIDILGQVTQIVAEKTRAKTGIHCCGNTDWSMLLGTGVDIVSLDAYGFGQYFVLYPKEIGRFLDRGGVVAWGFVPTAEYRASLGTDHIRQKATTCFEALDGKGIDMDVLLRQSLITPACGTGLMREEDATRVFGLTSALAKELLQEDSVMEDWGQI